MKNTFIFLLLCIAFIACNSKKNDNQANQQQSPQGPNGAYISSINSLTAKTDSLIAHDSIKTRYFALKNDKSIFEFSNGDNLPENLEEIYTVIYNLNQKPVCFINSPVSESGDWLLEHYFYFDQNGKTVFYRFYLGSFNSECTEVLRTYKDFVFDGNFNIVDKKEYYKDKEMKLFNPVDCPTPYSFDVNYAGHSGFENIINRYKIKLNK